MQKLPLFIGLRGTSVAFYRWSRLRMFLFAIEHDGDRSIVMDLHQHVLLKSTACHPKPAGVKIGEELLKEDFSFLRWCCLGKAGASPLFGIGEQGELAHHQKVAPRVQGGEVEPAFTIGEDAEAYRFLRQVMGIPLRVPPGYAQEHQQSRADLPHQFAGDAYRGFAHSLD